MAPWHLRVASGLVPVLSRLGRPGEWLIRRFGFVAFLSHTFTRHHADNCTLPTASLDLRPHGWVKRCDTCRMPVEIHFACWETDSGHMPTEVTAWIAEEVAALARLEATP